LVQAIFRGAIHGGSRLMRLKKLIKKINKKNAPPGGWKPEDRVQARKLSSLTRDLGYYKMNLTKEK